MSPAEELIGIIQRQTTNPNFLHTHRFRMVMHRTPSMVYFLQEMNLPGMTMGNPIQPTPFVDVPIHGDKIQFEDLVVSFAVDEDMKNYKEIRNWMVGLGFPQNFNQHKELVESMYGKTTDIMLVILDSNYNAQHFVMFRGAFPTSLGGLQFNTKDQDVAVQPVSVTFKYAYYEFIDLGNVTP